ncbi:MAG: pentapeptide repeat-containing protein [Isosphaeraceae bacterium]|nr:pentapeptide repeat-containing protein [Isosphaeraceae bacterium]
MDIPDLELTTTDEPVSPPEGVATAAAAGAPPSPTMPAEEALEKIRRGETIQGVMIVGLKLTGEFALPVRMRSVTLVQPVIEKAAFAAEVVFEHCTLDRPRFARNSRFTKGLTLTASTIIKGVFRAVTIQGTFRCNNIRCRGKFAVEWTRFEGRVRFWEARFQGWVEFKECVFADEADFRCICGEEGFVLNRCRFQSNALFRGATVHKKWQADGSRFEALLDLSKAKLHDFVYLEGIEQGEGQRFAFTNALAERILVRTEQLAGRLASEEAGDHVQAMQEYGLLKRVFEGLHRYEQEDWAFYRFKVNQRRVCLRSWRRPWTKLAQFTDWLLLDHGCGYGTNPLRAIRAAVVIMCTFALVYMAGIEALYVEHVPFADQPKTSLVNRLMIGTLTSVSAFTSGFGDIREAAQGWMNVPLIAESLLGTLLWGLFIVAFSRKVIR